MNILIVEDEAAALKRMEKLLKEIDPEVNIVGRTGTVKETVEWLEDNEWPDLAFFDIQLADGESFEVFHRTEVGCPVIFTTAYDEHALKAFRVNAVDYLLKPVRKGELSEAMERAGNLRVVRGRPAGREEAPGELVAKRFPIRYGDTFKVVEPKDIAYLYSLEKNTFLRTTEGKDLPMDESLDRLEKQLDPARFFRLNRQVIVGFESIKELIAYSKSRVKVIMEPPFGEDAIVSSERSAEFKRWLAGEG